MARLPFDARDYITWPLSNLPAGVTDVEVWLEGEWHPLELADDRKSGRVLISGPDFEGSDVAGQIKLTESNRSVRIRFTSDPQEVPRPAGAIILWNG